jgi:hypothetical protein
MIGDRRQAITMLDALLAKAPDDATLLRWRAECVAPFFPGNTPDGRAEARRLLVRAFAADASDWRTMLDYVLTVRRADGALSSNDLEVALRAHELAPQVSEIVIVTAVALGNAGRLADAATVLEPLAFATHDSIGTVFAKRLLAPARAGDQSGFLAAVRAPFPVAPQLVTRPLVSPAS